MTTTVTTTTALSLSEMARTHLAPLSLQSLLRHLTPLDRMQEHLAFEHGFSSTENPLLMPLAFVLYSGPQTPLFMYVQTLGTLLSSRMSCVNVNLELGISRSTCSVASPRLSPLSVSVSTLHLRISHSSHPLLPCIDPTVFWLTIYVLLYCVS